MLEFKDVSYSFKKSKQPILKNINFQINKGEIVGLVGSNGAGKTTLMKLIAKSRKPSKGSIFLNEINLNEKPNLLDDVGIMVDPVFYPHLSPKENIEFYLEINNKLKYIRDIDFILDLVGLLHVKNKPVKSFSFGMKQRCCLAICLITRPSLVIMDEPFVGLDPEGVSKLIDTLKSFANDNDMTILISSHQLNELHAVCSRYLHLNNGEIKAFEMDNRRKKTLYFNTHFNDDLIKDLTDKFDFIIEIKENKIIIDENSDGMSQILNKLSKSHHLINVEAHQNDLYQLFDENVVS
ncbi:ABC transporter ATP-binding protein [Mammaliicoccus sp. Dog046]|uniref:ABC transporter ATP-binding protein n=1 Tax=Mammaliicoccus sp. Dog046 TaxID=3034233 RepID=UPI002B25FA4B|nr:ABC transporter ATP-binding protein [Mammaliicoccus sp. Dog046]WQK84383.1 ABC transporter ATP-binding protein [Mammaliicoccus sp. Dog046]